MTFSRDDERPLLSVRVSPDLKERVENQPGTISDFVRAAVEDRLPDDGRDIRLPPEDDLREAYQELLHLVGDDGWVRDQTATNQLSQQFSRSETSVRRTLLVPLCKHEGDYLTRQSNATGRFVSYKVKVHTNE